jgi:hypothetical protein
MEGYCENAECRVVLFKAIMEGSTQIDQNCPGCGQFGRFKNEPRDES